MQEQINSIAVEITPVLIHGIHDLMENNSEVVSSFMKLFWKGQKKYLSINQNLSLSLVVKSSSAYGELRN